MRARGNGMETDQMPSPGAGNLPLIPDQNELTPLSAADTAAYLDQIANRILRERAEHRRRHVTKPPAHVKDW
jgi:hypothetical protein